MSGKVASITAAALWLLGCAGEPGAAHSESDLREDAGREPLVVQVPVRFSRNDPSDVGWLFSSSWIPYTDVERERADGYDWAAHSLSDASNIAASAAPDQPGAGYATAWFLVEIPYDMDGDLAYPLARVKLESEFISTEVATTFSRRYAPLRVRRGSDQPCMSVTASGDLEGKLKAIRLPFADEGFTERDWNLGDTDVNGVPIERVIVGTLRLSATCWPENVEGETHATGGLAGGVGVASGFLMIDKSGGQAGAGFATVYMNLVENEDGDVSVGELFSTSGTILRPRDVSAFDEEAAAFKEDFEAGIDRYVDDLGSAPPPGP